MCQTQVLASREPGAGAAAPVHLLRRAAELQDDCESRPVSPGIVRSSAAPWQEDGLVSLGHVAVDGTKVKANASRHEAMSQERIL